MTQKKSDWPRSFFCNFIFSLNPGDSFDPIRCDVIQPYVSFIRLEHSTTADGIWQVVNRWWMTNYWWWMIVYRDCCTRPQATNNSARNSEYFPRLHNRIYNREYVRVFKSDENVVRCVLVCSPEIYPDNVRRPASCACLPPPFIYFYLLWKYFLLKIIEMNVYWLIQHLVDSYQAMTYHW